MVPPAPVVVANTKLPVVLVGTTVDCKNTTKKPVSFRGTKMGLSQSPQGEVGKPAISAHKVSIVKPKEKRVLFGVFKQRCSANPMWNPSGFSANF